MHTEGDKCWHFHFHILNLSLSLDPESFFALSPVCRIHTECKNAMTRTGNTQFNSWLFFSSFLLFQFISWTFQHWNKIASIDTPHSQRWFLNKKEANTFQCANGTRARGRDGDKTNVKNIWNGNWDNRWLRTKSAQFYSVQIF